MLIRGTNARSSNSVSTTSAPQTPCVTSNEIYPTCKEAQEGNVMAEGHSLPITRRSAFMVCVCMIVRRVSGIS